MTRSILLAGLTGAYWAVAIVGVFVVHNGAFTVGILAGCIGGAMVINTAIEVMDALVARRRDALRAARWQRWGGPQG